MTKKRKLMTTITALSLTGLIISGTLAWTSMNSSRVNSWSGTADDPSTAAEYGGTLHDDHKDNEENKDVYVENWGENPIIVRLTLSEYMEIGQGAGIKNNPDLNQAVSIDTAHPDANIDDPSSWSPHAIQSGDTDPANPEGDIFHKYWEWEMGGQKYYYPAPTDKRGKPDENGIDYVDSLSPEDLDPSASADIKQTLSVDRIITIDEWAVLPAVQQVGNYWILDSDGSAYWAALLEPGEATGLLLNKVVLREKPTEDYYYGINVQAHMASLVVSLPETEELAARRAPTPDNYEVLLQTATEKGRVLINMIASAAQSSDQTSESTPTPPISDTDVTATPSPTEEPPANTATKTPLPTVLPIIPEEPTKQPVLTLTSTPTATTTPVPTATTTPVPTATTTPVPTATTTPVPTATTTPVPTATATPVPTATATPVPTATATPVPTATATPTPVPEITAEPTSAPEPESPPTPQTVVIEMFQAPEGQISYQLTNVLTYDAGIENPNSATQKASEMERGGTIIAQSPCIVTYMNAKTRLAPPVILKLLITQEQFEEFTANRYAFDELADAMGKDNLQDFIEDTENPDESFYWAYMQQLGNQKTTVLEEGYYAIGYALSRTGRLLDLVGTEDLLKNLTFNFGYLQVKG